MEFKDYYATLEVDRNASADEIKRSYRKLARKYHPDVSKEANAEARFKEVAEANEALSDPERRAAYDNLVLRRQRGERIDTPFGGGGGFDGGDHSDFFESLFGRRGRMQAAGEDLNAQVDIELEDAYSGVTRSLTMRVPTPGPQGRTLMQPRQLEVHIPAGVRSGQRLRLSGQGGAGRNGGPNGDLYLEIVLRPHRHFRVEGRDVYVDLPLAPWEAALGATVHAPTPQGEVQLSIAPGSAPGRQLRLKGRGLPGTPAGDLYAVLAITAPAATTPEAEAAYAALAAALPDYNARSSLLG